MPVGSIPGVDETGEELAVEVVEELSVEMPVFTGATMPVGSIPGVDKTGEELAVEVVLTVVGTIDGTMMLVGCVVLAVEFKGAIVLAGMVALSV
ncbi:hypothetical protein E8E11_004865 [Didymella keratinophila]|nr:hypothetical protein E8E11_004865 [Didymella keratinophila]